MSYRVTESVIVNSRYADTTDHKNFVKYRIVLEMARHADHDGSVGIAGESAKCLSARGIADNTGIHRNTVNTYLSAIQDDGEITMTGSGGKGRGMWRTWQINVPLIEAKNQPNGTTPQSGQVPLNDNPLESLLAIVPLIKEMAQQIKLMAQQNAEMAQQIALMAQRNGTNGTTLQSNPVPESRESENLRENHHPHYPPHDDEMAQSPNLDGDGDDEKSNEAFDLAVALVAETSQKPISRNSVRYRDDYRPHMVNLLSRPEVNWDFQIAYGLILEQLERFAMDGKLSVWKPETVIRPILGHLRAKHVNGHSPTPAPQWGGSM